MMKKTMKSAVRGGKKLATRGASALKKRAGTAAVKTKTKARSLTAKATAKAKTAAKAKPARNLVTRARKAVSSAVHNAEAAMRKVADDIVRAVN